ncbi:MAG TPA: YihY/virulence factor BrkB family protein, partial [Actinomycetota bacterium]
MSIISAGVRRADAVQRRHAFIAFPIAVVKKFGDDRAGQLAAVIAYYGFLSLFPLLLVFVTVLGFVLRDNVALQARILSSTLANFPIIGDQIRENIGSLSGSGVVVAAGFAGVLWAGLGAVRAFQNAMNDVWNVPRERRPTTLTAVLRALLAIVILGVVLVGGAILPRAAHVPWPVQVGSGVVALALNFVLFALAFRMLTVAAVSWRDVLPGAAVAAIGWVILQSVGGWFLGSRLQGASQIYGFFGIV